MCLLITVFSAGVILLPRVIWAPMFGDPGEVQLTAAVGGVGHPPGQAGIITIMRGLCLLLPFEPYLTVCLANTAFALGVVALLTLMQLRTGVRPVVAMLCSIIFMTDDQFWHAATTTETYATCFVLLACSIWSFTGWLHGAQPWKLWLAAALFCYLVVNRAPTVVLAVPFVAAVYAHHRARKFRTHRVWGKLLALAGIGLASLAVTVVSLWVRDVPGSAYNYLDQAGPSQPFYPQNNANFSDKAARFWWLFSARQYEYMFQPSWRALKGQTNWLVTELGAQHWPFMLAGGALTLLGARRLWRRNRPVALLVLLMIPAGVVPIMLIRVVSHTTLLPNVLFALFWLLGLGLTRVIEWHSSALWLATVLTAVCFTVWWTAGASFLRQEVEYDGRAHIKAIDLHALPPDTTLIDFDVVPLVYAQKVNGIRPDVKIVVPHGRMNREFLESAPGPVYTTRPSLPNELHAELVGDGPVWRIRLLDRNSAGQQGVPDS